MKTKTCKKCGIEKTIDCFSKHKDTRDRLRNACKDCLNKHNREWSNIPEIKKRKKEYGDKYRKENIDKIKKSREEYLIKNRDKLIAKRKTKEYKIKKSLADKKYREKYEDRLKDYRKDIYWNKKENKRWEIHFKCARDRCNYINCDSYKYYGAKGIKMLMTKEDFKFLWERDNADYMFRPSIDRIDSNGNYELENCQFLELEDNTRKANERRRK